jgi:hypothetical protein
MKKLLRVPAVILFCTAFYTCISMVFIFLIFSTIEANAFTKKECAKADGILQAVRRLTTVQEKSLISITNLLKACYVIYPNPSEKKPLTPCILIHEKSKNELSRLNKKYKRIEVNNAIVNQCVMEGKYTNEDNN